MWSAFCCTSKASPMPVCPPRPLTSANGILMPDIGGKQNIFKCLTKSGEIVAQKVNKRWALLESEVRMLDYATRQVQVKGPKLRGVFLNGDERTMVTDFDHGVQVGKVWKRMSKANQKLIIQQLRAEILKMRASTKSLIGRVGWDGEIDKDDLYWSPYNPDTRNYSVDYFASESEFDAHKVEQMRLRGGDAAATALESLIKPLQEQYSEKFVLTHGDLHDENIHVRYVKNSKGKSVWELSGILDWGSSGFYPEYMEFSVAMKSGPYRPYWQKVMKEVLKGMECTKERIKVEEWATYWAV
jgi:Phosphotransferase enzyme family